MADSTKITPTETIPRTLKDIIPNETLKQLPAFYQLLQKDKAAKPPKTVRSPFHEEEQYYCTAFYKPISRMVSFKNNVVKEDA